jgi:DNA-binding CsgD family transcriptional regulator
MQYNESPIAVMNIKMNETLMYAVMLQEIELNAPPREEKDEEFRVFISLTYYRDKKHFSIICKQGVVTVSKRQLECLQCLVDGLTVKQTASLLLLSIRTVENYLKILRNKFNCTNRIQLAKMLLG